MNIFKKDLTVYAARRKIPSFNKLHRHQGSHQIEWIICLLYPCPGFVVLRLNRKDYIMIFLIDRLNIVK